jgi:hypothetical protein
MGWSGGASWSTACLTLDLLPGKSSIGARGLASFEGSTGVAEWDLWRAFGIGLGVSNANRNTCS